MLADMTFSGRIVLLAVAVALAVPAAADPADAAKKRRKRIKGPNILIFMTDDQRVDTLEVMPKVQKWFGQHGTTYSNAFVSTPICCPSRGSLMTGRYVHNHRITDNYTSGNLVQRSTIQSIAKQAGYRTAIAGQYLNGWRPRVDPPFFDRWAVHRSGYFGAPWNVDGKVKRIQRYSTDFVRARTLKYLRQFDKKADKRPWLMWVNPFAPHEPFTPAPRHANAPVPPWQDPSPAVGEEDKSDKPEYVQRLDGGMEGGRRLREAQLRTLMSVDQMVHRVMKSLGKLREQRRTIAFFVSDNGYFWAEHGLSDKRLPYNEAVQVPLMVRWPGRVAKGAVDGRVASLVDIVPTILHVAGLRSRPYFPPDGRSLLLPGTRPYAFIEYFHDRLAAIPPWASVRTSAVHYTEYYEDDGTTVSFREYYDLAEDPYELENLLEDRDPTNDPPEEELEQLSATIAHDRACIGTTGPNACP
jgi:arylsulfatase A-like enzyme